MRLLESLPTYILDLPVSKQCTTYRPFVVSEEKKMLLTRMTQDKKLILLCAKNMLERCFGISDISNYSITDIEYMLLHLRGKSAGETEPFKMKCPYTDNDVYFTVSIVNNIVIEQQDTNTTISISKTKKIVMDIPRFKHILEAPDYDENTESSIKLIALCVSKIYDNDIDISSDMNLEEKISFLSKLKPKQLQKIVNFFDTVPCLFVEGKYLAQEKSETTEKTIRTVHIKGILNIINLFYDYINLVS
jgi:hypothetical protein